MDNQIKDILFVAACMWGIKIYGQYRYCKGFNDGVGQRLNDSKEVTNPQPAEQ